MRWWQGVATSNTSWCGCFTKFYIVSCQVIKKIFDIFAVHKLERQGNTFLDYFQSHKAAPETQNLPWKLKSPP